MIHFSKNCYFAFGNKLLKYKKSGLPGFCAINIQKSLGLGTESGNIQFCRNYQSNLSIQWSYKYEDNINCLNIAAVKSTTVITKRHKSRSRKTLNKKTEEDGSDNSDDDDADDDSDNDVWDYDSDYDDVLELTDKDIADGVPDTYKDVEIVTNKPRADRIISKALRLTNSEFEKYLYHSKGFLNHKVLLKKATKIKVGDVLDLQDTGDKVKRVKILKESLTKGGRERMLVRCWRAPFLLKKK